LRRKRATRAVKSRKRCDYFTAREDDPKTKTALQQSLAEGLWKHSHRRQSPPADHTEKKLN
jgi:hypothetical protein